jgi:hypothetical protein
MMANPTPLLVPPLLRLLPQIDTSSWLKKTLKTPSNLLHPSTDQALRYCSLSFLLAALSVAF